jgi:hypothetical protein
MNHRPRTLVDRMLIVAAMLAMLGASAPVHAVTFNDGGTHIIDAANSYPLDPVVVEDSPTGQPTTLIINAGGDIGSISGDGVTVNGSSVVTMNGGSIGLASSSLNGTSTFTLAGGSIFGDVRLCGERAQMRITGGEWGSIHICDGNTNPEKLHISGGTGGTIYPGPGGVLIDGGFVDAVIGGSFSTPPTVPSCSPIVVEGGTLVWFQPLRPCAEMIIRGSVSSQLNHQSGYPFSGILHVQEQAIVSTMKYLPAGSIFIEGGTLQVNHYVLSTIEVRGGAFSGSPRLGGQVTFAEGPFSGGSGVTTLDGGATALMYGGPITELTLSLIANSSLEIIGTDFNYPLGLISDGAGALGTLTGTLSDGSPISIDFQKSSTASILLRAPATPTNSDLAVSFVSPPTTVDTYGTVNLLFSVSNAGPDPVDNVEVTFDAPATAINPTITTGTWSQGGSTFTSDLGTLASGASATFEMTYSVGGDAGTLDHQISVFSNIFDPISIDPDELNNTATASITVQCGTTVVYGQNPSTLDWTAFGGSCEVPSGWTLSVTPPVGFVPVGYDSGYSDGAASVDTQFYYDTGYGAGTASVDTQSYYDTGYGAGAASVDTQSYYDTGYGACLIADGTGDFDLDGIVDDSDNCLFVANPVQTDTDHDGYGNICDADINNDGGVGFDDVAEIFAAMSSGSYSAADLNGDGGVGLDDASMALGMNGTLPGPSGYSCAGTAPCGPGVGARFVACADSFTGQPDGTVEDRETGLLWEQKTGTFDLGPGGNVDCSLTPCPDPHDVNNLYQWSSTVVGGIYQRDGSAFTDFLPRLNGTLPAGSACFAGHCDWDLPELSELQSILIGAGVLFDEAQDGGIPADPTAGTNPTGQATTCNAVEPCADPAFAAIGGPIAPSYHWTNVTAVDVERRIAVGTPFEQTILVPRPDQAYVAFFSTGEVNVGQKQQLSGLQLPQLDAFVRAVRPGSCTP